MLRQDASATNSDSSNGLVAHARASNQAAHREATRIGGVDIQRELDKLEEIVLGSPRVPLTRRTMVDEDQLIYQLDLVRLNLPPAFQEALEIVRHKEEILQEAEQYAQEIIETAERRATQILDEMNLRRQADLEVQQLRQRVQQECEVAQEQTLAEIERMRHQAQLELEEMHQMAIAESEDIQAGADAYADRVLRDMEQRLSDMLRVIRNGRHQLKPDAPQRREPDGSAPRSGQTGRPPERPSR